MADTTITRGRHFPNSTLGDESPVRLVHTAVLRTSKVSTADLAWTAAVLDMKGKIAQKGGARRRFPQVTLSVMSKDPRISGRLCALTGTAPEARKAPQVSDYLRRQCAEHCADPHVHVTDYPWKMPDVVTWGVSGVAVVVILRNTGPYMTTISDYDEITRLITENMVLEGRGVGMVRASVTRLRDLGWEIPAEISSRLL